ncbi:subtilisin-like serine peptidase [Leptomonas seymouri]|uniref:Subtilisin-like serine peptidase n=1 Tax=Leptomonas seymouri TaxID=5684 RepID=A0A0N1IMU4_LEPSE|nr:subtilisin-like serine peptidase [Leptomonas seymouri]|eukprot:KPI90684.1 subtilisin-like serine peptidase [Leptomonas seymouri]
MHSGQTAESEISTTKTVLLLQDNKDEGRTCGVPEASSSSTHCTAPACSSSLVASLTSRYAVLSRTVASPLKKTKRALHDSALATPLCGGNDIVNASHHAPATSLTVSPLSQKDKHRSKGSFPSLSLGEGAPPSRLFPEEALRHVAQTASAFAKANGQRSTETRAPTVSAVHHHSTEALSTGARSPPRQLQQLHQDSETSSAAYAELEIHVIDAAHILVFFPPSEESAALLRAMAADRLNGVTWRAWDVFSSAGGGPQLKLSEPLRGLIEEASSFSANLSATAFSSPFERYEGNRLRATHEVTLWTARGHAAAVQVALTTSARLQPYFKRIDDRNSSPTGTAFPKCHLTIEPADEKADAVWVRVYVTTQLHHADTVLTGEDGAPLLYSASQAQRHLATQHENCLRDVLMALAAHPAVRWVEESYRRPEMLNKKVTKVTQQGGCSTYSATANAYTDDNTEAGINAPLWDLGLNGSGEIIAIGDSGVDTESCYFRDPAEAIAYYPDVNPRHRKIISYHAYVAADGMVDATDRPKGHGTHVAGIASGCMAPSSDEGTPDAALFNGVAPGAKLFVRDLNGGTSTDLSLPLNLQEIFESAYRVGARISSNSWGFQSQVPSYSAMEKVFDATVADRRDLLVLAAVGNSGKNNVYIPARAKNVLTVGSHLNSPLTKLQNTVSDSSAYGVTYDQRRKPDLIASGGSGGDKAPVFSAMAATKRSCGTTKLHGTSMATAAVAGAAAVVRQYLREWWGFDNPSSALLRAALLHSTTAIPMEPLRSGFGRLDLSHLLPHRNHTVDQSLPPLEQWFVDDALVRDGQVRQYCFALTGLSAFHNRSRDGETTGKGGISCSRAASLTVTATLVWNDPGTAAEGSVRSQVHDLDLMLATLHGHTFFSGPNGVTRERFSTVEQVRVPLSFTSGDRAETRTSVAEWMHGFRVLVRGAEVRRAAGQSFALAVSGPGLARVPECPVLFDQWRTASERKPQQSPTVTSCPMNCTGRGMCDERSLLCLCEPNYTSVDCAECNAAELCHGRGTCDTRTMTCTCDPRGRFADARCATCQKGWYGPECAFNCTCLHGGVCDKTSGLCSCVQDATLPKGGKGCFQGPHCQYCCDGFGGPACNQRSYWCNTKGDVVVVDDQGGGFIQINDFNTYGHSSTCRWSIRGKPGQRIQLKFISYDVEQYDALYVYDIVQSPASAAGGSAQAPTQRKQVGRVSGPMAEPIPVITSTAEQMDLEFVSDWDGAGKGFVIYYRFTSCNEKCGRTNLTGPLGHWRCGDVFELPTKQCICEPPYVGWHCNEDASDTRLLSRELDALQISNKRVWQDGELAWMLPRSMLTAVEVRMPVQLAASSVDVGASLPLSEAWKQWRSRSVAFPTLKAPVTGMARLPLVVHGFSEIQMPLLTLPTPAFFVSAAEAAGVPLGSTDGENRLLVTAQLKLQVQLQMDATWLNNGARALELTLGVSAAKGTTDVTRKPIEGDHEAATPVSYNDITAPLSLDAFTFTPMTLQNLLHCADGPVMEITVPLNLLADTHAPSKGFSSPSTGSTAAVTGDRREVTAVAEEESHWTSRVIFTLLWKDAAGITAPNVSVVDAVVFAHEVVLTKKMPMNTATGKLPVAASTLRGNAVEVSCHSVTRVPAHTSQQVTETTSLRVETSKTIPTVVRFFVLFFALCAGVVGGLIWVFWKQDRRRPTFMPVPNNDEGQDMQVMAKRG